MTRALVTGGAGSVGTHLSEALLAVGYDVTIIGDLSTGRFEDIEHLIGHPNFHFAIEKIKALIGWEAKTPLDGTLVQVAAYLWEEQASPVLDR